MAIRNVPRTEGASKNEDRSRRIPADRIKVTRKRQTVDTSYRTENSEEVPQETRSLPLDEDDEYEQATPDDQEDEDTEYSTIEMAPEPAPRLPYDPKGVGFLIWDGEDDEDGVWVPADCQASGMTPPLAIELTEEMQSQPRKCCYRLQRVQDWSSGFSGGLFDLLRATGGKYTVELAGQHYSRLLPALLTLVRKYETHVEQNNLLLAIKFAAALEYGIENAREAVAEICQAYHRVDLLLPAKKALEKSIRNLAGEEHRTAKQLVPEIAEKFLRSLQPETVDAKCLALWNGFWYRYDGNKWSEWPGKELRAAISTFWQGQLCADKITLTKTLREDIIVNLEGICRQVPGKQSMPAWICHDGRHIDSPYLGVANGLLNLEPMFAGQQPDLCLPDARHFATACLPIECDPDAECPLWLQTLEEIFPNKSMAANPKTGLPEIVDRRCRVLQQFVGWILLPNRLRLEKCLILYGSGANGKGLIMNVIRKLVGLPNISSLQLERVGGPHVLAQLLGKLVNLVSEIGRVERFEEGLLKQLISGDPVTINPKHQPEFTTILGLKLIFATNNLPPINDKTRGTKRKLILMLLQESFEGREDFGRERALEAELPGILNWALEGAVDLIACGGFAECDMCNQAATKHGLDCDPIEQWILDRCRIAPDWEIPLAEVYENYKDWCAATGHGTLNATNFVTQLGSRGGIQVVRKGTSGPRPRRVIGLHCVKSPSTAQRRY